MKLSIPQTVLIGLVIVVCGAFVFGGVTSGAAFDSFNPNWDGTSDLRSTAEAANSETVVVTNATRYAEYGANDTAFILAPDRSYSDPEIERIRRFIDRGGQLVVADRNGPTSAALLDSIGVSARPDGAILRDDQHYYRNPALPIATTVTNQTLVESEREITLNYGTAVEPNGATVVANSSEFAYLDRDESGALSENETLRTHPVVTTERVGDGQVVVVGDPSLFINVMQGREGNRVFTTMLINESDHTLIDVSHSRSPPALVHTLLRIRGSQWLQIGIGMFGLSIVGLWARRPFSFEILTRR